MKDDSKLNFKEIVIIIFIAVVINTQVCGLVKVPTLSMYPTINAHDKLLINKLAPKYKTIARGDIVVFIRPDEQSKDVHYIKRVVGLPNETIDIQNGLVYVNGTPLNEPYALGDTFAYTTGITFPYVVPEGSYLLMGDNRENSYDGRFIGAISKKDINAVGTFKVYPFNDLGILK